MFGIPSAGGAGKHRGPGTLGSAVLAVALGVLLAGPATASEGVLHVDDDGPDGGSGATWGEAIRFLQDALLLAQTSGGAIREIRIAEGTYTPDRGEGQITGDRAAAFRPGSGLRLLGGYAGLGEDDPDRRDPRRFPAILSGDLAGDDGPGFAGNDENSFHVMILGGTDEETRLDGLVISGGHADGPAPDDRGAGLWIDDAESTVVDVVVAGNEAFLGGGICVTDGAPVLRRLTVEGNRAVLGGGLAAAGGAPAIDASTVRANAATFGGGIHLDGGAAALVSTSIAANTASADGGGLYAIGSAATVTAGRLSGNVAGFEGGGLAVVASSVIFADGVVQSNVAFRGGGLACVGGAPVVTGCRFQSNAATLGGAVAARVSAIEATGNRYVGNTANDAGGAWHDDGGMGTITGERFTSNAADEGGAIFVVGGVTRFEDCTVTMNSATSVGAGMVLENSAATVSGCAFEANVVAGGFVSTGGAIAARGGGAPSIESSSFVANEARFGGAIAVQGADPLVTACLIHANLGISGGGVHVTAGSIRLDTCTIESNVVALGPTSSGGGIYVRDGELEVRRCVLRGNISDRAGGGIHLDGGFATVTESLVADNTAAVFGGGLFVEQADATLDRVRFVGNEGSTGGGVAVLFGGCVVNGCLFNGNLARGILDEQGGCGASGGQGGGLASIAGSTVISGATFSANEAGCGGTGGGIFGVRGLVVNCILWGNRDAGGGGESAQLTGGFPSVAYSCVEGLTGGLGGEGNIGLDPGFRDPVGPDGIPGTLDDDRRPGAGSPCIDAGDSTRVPEGDDRDLAGQPRFVDDPATRDTGAGEPPIVDMGPYEFQAGACAGDIDGDGIVDFDDLVRILFAWGPCDGCPEDVDASGDVGLGDLLVVLASWGTC